MLSDEKKIKSVLEAGKEILSSRPELVSMKLSDVLNELDDGTPKMSRDRWGVTAWIVTNSILDFKNESLVEQLSKVDSGELTYEYVGYLLLKKYEVNLEDLLLQAEKCGLFDKIVPFVLENLVYEVDFYEQNVLPILQVMENHLEYQSYHRLLWNYAKHIENLGAQHSVEILIGDLNRQSQYDLMNKLCAGWYARDINEAHEALKGFLTRKGIWNKKAAFEYLRVSLYHNRAIFQQHFAQIEAMSLMDNQLYLMTIPLYIEYICTANSQEQNDVDYVQKQIYEHLKEILLGSLDAKYSFLEALQYVENIPENLYFIMKSILSQPFNKEQRFLNILDHLLCFQIQKVDWIEALNLMQEAFIANHYSGDYDTFFHSMNLVREGMLTHSKDITLQAIEHILSGSIERLFFGLGLLVSFGDIEKLYKNDSVAIPSLPITLDSYQAIQLEKAILYFTIDTPKICQIAFQLIELGSGENEQYMAFCLEEVFENYPATMYKTAKRYQAAANRAQVELSKRVMQTYEQQMADKKKCYEIIDLHPYREHLYVYRRALAEQNRKICNQANQESFFGQLFKSRKLKYGVRNAHTMIGRKGERIFQVSPYAHIQHEIELPALYICDPVGLELRNQTYLKEVKSNASNHKGLFATTEREG